MLAGNGGRSAALWRIARFAVFLLLASLCNGLNPALAAGESPRMAAVWVPKELTFQYVGFTTKYSCEGLREKMRAILLQLGARPDLDVSDYACMRVAGPQTTPGVRISMHVLQPASAPGADVVAAHWGTVDLLAKRDPLDAALDCELVAQLRQQVLPLFATGHIDYAAACSVNDPLIGGTRLKVDVLLPEAPPLPPPGTPR